MRITKTQLSLPSDQELLVTRTFNAPRDLVWQMWTSVRTPAKLVGARRVDLACLRA
jgi:uncharacterized protein YndB with AHSA1/START domain